MGDRLHLMSLDSNSILWLHKIMYKCISVSYKRKANIFYMTHAVQNNCDILLLGYNKLHLCCGVNLYKLHNLKWHYFQLYGSRFVLLVLIIHMSSLFVTILRGSPILVHLYYGLSCILFVVSRMVLNLLHAFMVV